MSTSTINNHFKKAREAGYLDGMTITEQGHKLLKRLFDDGRF